MPLAEEMLRMAPLLLHTERRNKDELKGRWQQTNWRSILEQAEKMVLCLCTRCTETGLPDHQSGAGIDEIKDTARTATKYLV